MMLTEPYHYSRNKPAAEASGRRTFYLSPASEEAACTAVVISASDISCNHPVRPFCTTPQSAADELADTLEAALRRVTTLSADTSPSLVDLARGALAALTRIRIAGRLANISAQVAREFRLRPDDLLSRSREQRIGFVRQLAMYLCRKITGASFESIGEHFNRDHSSVIHACELIERRIEGETAFRLFIEKLEGKITRTMPTTAAAAA